jgi:hypothetical protein
MCHEISSWSTQHRQGQGPLATALIERSAVSGDWVLLQNCHVATSYLPFLEQLLMALKAPSHERMKLHMTTAAMDIHDDFRLFLTSLPTPAFPVRTIVIESRRYIYRISYIHTSLSIDLLIYSSIYLLIYINLYRSISIYWSIYLYLSMYL